MVELKRSSFIYQHILSTSAKAEIRSNGRVSLCSLFWMVVGGCLMWLAVGVLIAAIAVVMLSPLYQIIAYFTSLPLIVTKDDGAEILLTLGVVFNVVAAVGIIDWILQKRGTTFSKAIGWDKIKPKKKNKEPGLITSYLKAKKEKVCPIIEFKDDE